MLRFDPASGDTEVVAGTGEPGSAGDGGPALDAQISEPTGLALAPDGTLFSPTSPRTACAGSIRRARSRLVAELIGAAEVALDPTGPPARRPALGHVVFRIDLRTGKPTRLAGTGNAATTGDGGPARGADVESPHGAAYDADGNLYIPDGASIRRIDAQHRRDHDDRRTAAETRVTVDRAEAGLIAVKLFFGPGGGST